MKSRKPPVWPRSKLVRIDPTLPIAERVELYRQNIRTIRASGCNVPSVMPDTLDAATIAAWFDANDEYSRRLKSVIRTLARLDAGITIPVALAPLPRATVRMSKGARR